MYVYLCMYVCIYIYIYIHIYMFIMIYSSPGGDRTMHVEALQWLNRIFTGTPLMGCSDVSMLLMCERKPFQVP